MSFPLRKRKTGGGGATVMAKANDGYHIGSWEGVTRGTGIGEQAGEGVVDNIQSDVSITCNFLPNVPVYKNKTVISFNRNLNMEGINGLNITSNNASLYDADGNLSFIYKITADRPNQSGAFEANISPGAPYPYEVYRNAVYLYPSAADLSKSANMDFEAVDKNATYTVRLYCNTKNAGGNKNANMFYSINGVEQSPTFSLTDNAANFMEWNNVSLINGLINIRMRANAAWSAVVYNVVEIYKE